MNKIDETKPFKPVNIAVLTVSDTRTLETDKSGDTLVERIARDGHVLADRAIVTDDVALIRAQVQKWIDDPNIEVVISTGGTGVTGRDVTPEALEALFEKKIEGFGETFRWISFQKIGTSTMQSRATAGVANATYIPGTALVGGRRYVMGQNDREFTHTISAPNGGYCTFPSVAVSEECEANEDMCDTMDSCFYRTAGAGRWFHAAESTRCVSNCTHPLVFCDKGRCASTMGCSWFIKSQANVDQCYCIDNPGLNGNPPAKPRMTWIFWDQPVSIPIFVIACIAVIGIAYNVWLFNLKPFFARVFKRKPKE